MKTKLLAVGALATALLIPGVPLGGGTASAATQVPKTTLMLAGDSITEGLDGDYTYRYRLAMEFERQGISDSVDLVGPKSRPKGTYGNYLGGRGWDFNHDGTSGTTLKTQVDNIGPEIAQYQPDVLVSYLGTNDFLDVIRASANQGKSAAQMLALYEAKVDEVLEYWKAYLAAVKAEQPEIKIVLGELVTPRVPQAIREKYNGRLTDLAAQLASNPLSGFRIEVAQLDSPLWSSPIYLYDRTHPAPTGEAMFAQLFADRIASITSNVANEFGIFTSAPQIQRRFIPWDPPIAAKVRVLGKKVRLDWSFAARYNRTTAMRVKIKSAKTGRTLTSPFLSATTWKTKKLKPGTYRIQLQGARYSMKSTWGRTMKVKIKPGPKSAR